MSCTPPRPARRPAPHRRQWRDLRYLRASTGAGRQVILLHPLRAQLEYFLRLLTCLDRGDLDVLVPDHGASSASRRGVTPSRAKLTLMSAARG